MRNLKTICIAGKNDIAVDVLQYCLENYPEREIVCITNRNETGANGWQKSLKWFAEKSGAAVKTLEDVYKIEDLVFLSLEFDKIINPSLFRSSRLYNIHFSMLPSYKGMYTSIFPILHGEAYTGVTLHKINSGIDTGEIIDQKRVEICGGDSSLDLYKKLIGAGTELVIENLERLLNNNVTLYPQPAEKSTYYPSSSIDFSTLSLDVNRTAFQIKNQIDAFCFRPYQLIQWREIPYIGCEITSQPSVCRPGTILEENRAVSRISTVDYDVVLFKDVFYDLLDAITEHRSAEAKELCVSERMITSRDSNGCSALTVAVRSNNKEMYYYLKEQGADIHIRDYEGRNMLVYAMESGLKTGDWDLFVSMVESGISVFDTDYNGKTVFECIERNDLMNLPYEIRELINKHNEIIL